MTLDEFVLQYNNKPVDFDGSFGNQCMDLMHFYIRDVLQIEGNALFAPTAYQAYQKGDDRFDKIANYSGQKPQAGDIIFWNTGVGSAGHVAVFLNAAEYEQFVSFDQNWPVGSFCHRQIHDYKHVAGWLRLKTAPVPPEDNQPKKYMQIVKNAQMIWTKVPITPGNNDTETRYWVIVRRDDGKEVKREVKKHIPFCSLVFAVNDSYHRWNTPEQFAMLSNFPVGEEYDIHQVLANHPELLEKQLGCPIVPHGTFWSKH